ncbi:MAG: ANTAR domain-containing protein [Fuerstiella sp.]
MPRDVNAPRTIYLAHGDPDQRIILRTLLESLGHEVPVVTDNGHHFIEKAINRPADILIASPRLADMDGIETLIRIGEIRPTPSILVSRSDDLEKVERAMEDHVMAYLVEPVTAEVLMPSIYLCQRRFEHFERLQEKIGRLRRSLEERRVIERAKLVLMQAREISEADAHIFLQKTATAKRKRLADIAAAVVDASDLLAPQEEHRESEI